MKVWIALDEGEAELLRAILADAALKTPDDRLRSIRCRLQADLEHARRQEERIAA